MVTLFSEMKVFLTFLCLFVVAIHGCSITSMNQCAHASVDCAIICYNSTIKDNSKCSDCIIETTSNCCTCLFGRTEVCNNEQIIQLMKEISKTFQQNNKIDIRGVSACQEHFCWMNGMKYSPGSIFGSLYCCNSGTWVHDWRNC